MKAYEGNDNYIFVSYSHADSQTVLPTVEALQNAGFRVWYDLGIEAGTEWPAYIEEHLNNCSRIIAFISPSAVESVNCRNEINYALMKKKEMLVVYLEDTELKYGLSLQLNAIQSLFKSRHQSLRTFYDELINAQMLQCCRGEETGDKGGKKGPIIDDSGDPETLDKALDSGNRTRIKASRALNTAALATVGTIPSNDPSNPWPAGTYSQTVNEDQFSVIHFHCKFIRPVTESRNKNIGIMIFDSDDNLVFDYRTSLYFEKNYDRFSLCWVIADANGLKQKTGDYTAIVWVDESSVFEYSFRIVSNNGLGLNTAAPAQKNASEVEKLKSKLVWPKLARRYWLSYILTMFGAVLLTESSNDTASIVIGVIFLLIALWAYISSWKLSRKHMINHGVGNALAMTLGSTYYGIFLIGAGIYALCNKNKWKKMIAQYESGIIS